MDLRSQLEQHLGSSYAIERELGGGGMSRVFVADELRLGRTVVIKVLSPDLVQGLNAERFEREIKVAASLQQANIVPLLVAGEVAGIPYFTMPYVDGESLRHRLAQGPMPTAEIIGILRDVARALAYAHARGVVHRDIKPDNVLLSGGAAVVTDFGIAKAISVARGDADRPGRPEDGPNRSANALTALGTSIGTPAYMAPEQVAGDPGLDHRVDLYALGCVAYELLTGQQPYANRTPQKMLAAHLSEAVPSAAALRADAPPALVDLAARLMAKDPADRPQSAAEVVQALDQAVTTSAPTVAFLGPGTFRKALLGWVAATVVVLLCARAAMIAIGLPDWVFPGAAVVMALGLPVLLLTGYVQRVARTMATATPTLTPGGTMMPQGPSGTMATMAIKASPHLTWRRTRRGGVIAIGGFAAVVALFMATRALGIGPWGSLLAAGKLAASDRIVLADFDVPTADSALVPIVGAAVRAALSQSRSINLVSQSEIADVLSEMKQSRDAPLHDVALVRDVAQRAGAKAVLAGRLAPIGSGYAISLDLTAAQGGAVLASYQATAAGSTDLLSVIDALTRKLRGKVGESLKQVQQSVPLQRATTTSLDALRKYSEAVQANDVDEDFPHAVRAAREAVALDSTFALAWRKLYVALFNSAGSSAAQDSAIREAARYADRLPDREKYLVLGSASDAGSLSADRAKALAAYRSAWAADSSSVTASNQLALIYQNRGEFDSAVPYVRRQLKIQPVPANVGRLVAVLTIANHVDDAQALLDSFSRATGNRDSSLMIVGARATLYAQRQQYDSLRHLADAVAKSPRQIDPASVLGIVQLTATLGGQLRRGIDADTALQAYQVRQHLAPLFLLDEPTDDILFRDRNQDGLRLLDGIVTSREWTGAAPADRPYLQVVTLYARGGNSARANELLHEYLTGPTDAKAPDAATNIAMASGEIALAEGKTSEALTDFHRSATMGDGAPAPCMSCVDFALARAFDAAGVHDSAVVYLERYLAVPPGWRTTDVYYESDQFDLAPVEKRLGELYEADHDKAKAVAHYTAFVDLWKNADADLQPAVASVRKRVAELTTAEGP